MIKYFASQQTSECEQHFDLSHLSEMQQLQLRGLSDQYFNSLKRIEQEFVYLSTHVGKMQEILGDDLTKYAEQVLGIKPRTLNRLLTIERVLKTKLSDDNIINVNEAKQFTRGALYLLSPVTDSDIFEEVRQLAQNGVRINEAVVREIINSRNVKYEEQITIVNAELSKNTKDLETLKAKTDLEISRAQMMIAKQSELLRREQDTKILLEEEIETLRRQTSIVAIEERKIEVLPEDYSSLEEAINSQRKKMLELESQKKETETQIAFLNEKQTSLKETIGNLEQTTTDYVQLRTVVEQLISQFPLIKLQLLKNSSNSMRENITALGLTMIELGTHLSNTNMQLHKVK